MKALVKREAGKGIWMEEVPKPEVGMNDVLIRVLKSAICGTDLHIYLWDEWAARTIPVPMVVGHEFVGEIVQVGANVNDFHPGQIVSGEGHVVCGRCRNFKAGRRHICADTSGVGVNPPGSFSEYIALPMSNVWEHRPGIDLDIASIFDPFGNAVHTALQFDLLGEDVLITGAGPIGCMAAAVCRHAGARNVVITDLSDYRLNLAAALGAKRTVNVSHESLEDVMEDLSMNEGFDVALEMSGAPSAFQNILDNLCHGGKIAVLGIPSKDYSIDWQKVIFNMITIRGVYGREMYETWYKMSVFIDTGLDLAPIITHRLPISEFQQGFDVMESGESGKVVLDWTG
jgi:threonine 3-dehydrogenase